MGSVLLLCLMYNLFLSRVKFLFLPPVPSFFGQSMLATDSLAWWWWWRGSNSLIFREVTFLPR